MYTLYNKSKPFAAEELPEEVKEEEGIEPYVPGARGYHHGKEHTCSSVDHYDTKNAAKSAKKRTVRVSSAKALGLAPPQDNVLGSNNASAKALALSSQQNIIQTAVEDIGVTRPGAYGINGPAGVQNTEDASYLDHMDIETPTGDINTPEIQATLVNEGTAISAIPLDLVKENDSSRWKRVGVLVATVVTSAIVVALSIALTRSPRGNLTTSTGEPTGSPTGSTSPTTSSQPSFAPTTVIFKDMLRLITSLSPTSPVNDTTSPQFEALQWLSTESYHMTLSDDRLVQRFVLATLYFAANGPGWSFGQSWLSATNECDDWFPTGLQCDDVSGMLEFVKIDSGRELQGSLPAEFGLLTNLKYLNLANQALTGSIPTELGRLSLLSSCSVLGNEFSRNIPTELGLLRMLNSLNLANNGIVGLIPTEIGLLSQLTELILARNELIGSSPTEFGQLTRLQNLDLAQNPFMTGTIPTELGLLGEKLTGLHLFEAGLTGSIPTELGHLRVLSDWGLSQNRLTGQIPTELGLLTNSLVLNLWQNQLTGPLPSEIGEMTLVRAMSVRANNLIGTIPTDMGRLSSLTNLGLGDNDFTGAIPANLCQSGVRDIFIDCGELNCFPGCCLCN